MTLFRGLRPSPRGLAFVLTDDARVRELEGMLEEAFRRSRPDTEVRYYLAERLGLVRVQELLDEAAGKSDATTRDQDDTPAPD